MKKSIEIIKKWDHNDLMETAFNWDLNDRVWIGTK